MSRFKNKKKYNDDLRSPDAPKIGFCAQKGFREPKRKYLNRCSMCSGTGLIKSLNGWIDCLKCGEE